MNRKSICFLVFLALLTPSYTQQWQAKVQAWLYPASDTCNTAKTEMNDGRGFYSLKPEYFSVNNNGIWRWLNESASDPESCNGYSAANVANIKAKSIIQYVTVSAGAGVGPFVANSAQTSSAITTWVNFCVQSGFKGVELDFEGYGDWTATTYTQFKTFITNLGNALHVQGKELMLNGPPIYDATSQSWYEWKYEDFVNLPVDWMSVMAYDYMYDWGAGTAVQPLDWMDNIITWTLAKYGNINKVVIGIPSYGYWGTVDTWVINRVNRDQALARAGSNTAARDAGSSEMKWTRNNVATFYCDTTSLNTKRTRIEARGIKHVSVFHLGGTAWFTGTEPVGGYVVPGQASSAQPTPSSAQPVPSSAQPVPSSGQPVQTSDQTPSSGQPTPSSGGVTPTPSSGGVTPTPSENQTPTSAPVYTQPGSTESPISTNPSNAVGNDGTCVVLCSAQEDEFLARVNNTKSSTPITIAIIVGALIGIITLVIGLIVGFYLGQRNPDFAIWSKKTDPSAGTQLVSITMPGPPSRTNSESFGEVDSPSVPRGVSRRNIFQPGLVDSPDIRRAPKLNEVEMKPVGTRQ